MYILKVKYIKLYIIIFLFLIAVKPVHASTLPLNASSTSQNLEDYSAYYTRLTSGWGCTGYGTTHDSALFFDRNCAVYQLGDFQSSITFHITNNNDFVSDAAITTWWGNNAQTIKAFGTLETEGATQSAVFTPFLTFDGGASGLQNIQATNITLTYPFDVTFTYNITDVIIQVNGATVLQYPVDVSVHDKTVIEGTSLQISGLTATTDPTISNQFVTCEALDIGCQFYNLKLWLTKLLLPTTASLDQIATIKTTLDNKIPFAYFSTATGLNFTASGVATNTPGFTLPMMSVIASTSGQRFHPITSGSLGSPLSFNGSNMTMIGQYSKPFFSISMWLGFIMLVVQITIKMLT